MVFVFDIDGTICFNGIHIEQPIVDAIEQLKKNGHRIIFASARPLRDMLPVLPDKWHNGELIGGNGSLIQHSNGEISCTKFDWQTRMHLEQLLTRYKAEYLADSKWNYCFYGKDHPVLKQVDAGKLAQAVPINRLDELVKLLILHSDDWAALEQELEQLAVVIHKHRNEQTLDISPPGVHKWAALQALGIQAGNFYAFGNDANDLTMFQHAEYAVQIGDHDGLSHLCSHQLLRTDDIIECLHQYLLKFA